MNIKMKNEWNKWVKSAKCCKIFEVPRFYDAKMPRESLCTELVGFCDASEKGYAAVIYLWTKSISNDGTGVKTISTNLVAAKTRIAPLVKRDITILEALGALILARLMFKIKHILCMYTKKM